MCTDMKWQEKETFKPGTFSLEQNPTDPSVQHDVYYHYII